MKAFPFLIVAALFCLPFRPAFAAADIILPEGQDQQSSIVAEQSPLSDDEKAVTVDLKCSDFGAIMERDFHDPSSVGPHAADHVKQFKGLLASHLPQNASSFIMTAFTQEVVGYCAKNEEKTLEEAIAASVAAVNFAIRQAISEKTVENERRGQKRPSPHIFTPEELKARQAQSSMVVEPFVEMPKSQGEQPAFEPSREDHRAFKEMDEEPSLPKENVGTMIMNGSL